MLSILVFSSKTNYKEYKEGRKGGKKEAREEQGVIIYLLMTGIDKPGYACGEVLCLENQESKCYNSV